MTDQVNSPDSLKSDVDSKEFYILRDEQVAICKNRRDLPYWKNRSTYLSSGRFSPKHKKVIFWPEPINPAKAMKLLEENMHISDDYTYAVANSATKSPKNNMDQNDKFTGVRKRQIENLMNKGMKKQENANNSQEN